MVKKGKSRKMRGGSIETQLRKKGFSNAAVAAAVAVELQAKDNPNISKLAGFYRAKRIGNAAEAAARQVAAREKEIANAKAAQEAAEEAVEKAYLEDLHEKALANEAEIEPFREVTRQAQRIQNTISPVGSLEPGLNKYPELPEPSESIFGSAYRGLTSLFSKSGGKRTHKKRHAKKSKTVKRRHH